MEFTAYSGAFTSVYVYSANGQKVWKSNAEFSSDVDRMSADQLQQWFERVASEYIRHREEWARFNQTSQPAAKG